jgi:hypothetical protein
VVLRVAARDIVVEDRPSQVRIAAPWRWSGRLTDRHIDAGDAHRRFTARDQAADDGDDLPATLVEEGRVRPPASWPGRRRARVEP